MSEIIIDEEGKEIKMSTNKIPLEIHMPNPSKPLLFRKDAFERI